MVPNSFNSFCWAAFSAWSLTGVGAERLHRCLGSHHFGSRSLFQTDPGKLTSPDPLRRVCCPPSWFKVPVSSAPPDSLPGKSTCLKPWVSWMCVEEWDESSNLLSWSAGPLASEPWATAQTVCKLEKLAQRASERV